MDKAFNLQIKGENEKLKVTGNKRFECSFQLGISNICIIINCAIAWIIYKVEYTMQIAYMYLHLKSDISHGGH